MNKFDDFRGVHHFYLGSLIEVILWLCSGDTNLGLYAISSLGLFLSIFASDCIIQSEDGKENFVCFICFIFSGLCVVGVFAFQLTPIARIAILLASLIKFDDFVEHAWRRLTGYMDYESPLSRTIGRWLWQFRLVRVLTSWLDKLLGKS